jgi:lipopolysaccharide/colanic/teichoic acid biosynthesis glycosyltransferase
LADLRSVVLGLRDERPFPLSGEVVPFERPSRRSLASQLVAVPVTGLDMVAEALRARPVSPLRRALDLTLAISAGLFLLPVLVAIAATIKLQDGGPILFSQERIGRGGRRFRCYKFRSMRPDAEVHLEKMLRADPAMRAEWDLNHKLRDDPRITRFGAFLRRSSLDELPQILNVIAGEMSVVGPRPIVEAEIARYGRWYRYYTSVSPGLTGLWQVSGRSNTSYRRRVATDRLFVRMNSLESYVRILAATVPAVLARRGAC